MNRLRLAWVVASGAAGLALAILALGRLSYFLSVSEPEKTADYLVVEDWLPPYVLRQAVDEFNRSNYTRVIAVGVARERLDAADLLCEINLPDALMRLGIRGGKDSILSVLRTEVDRDRTFHSAAAVKTALSAGAIRGDATFNVLTVGPHARRTRLLYRAALGEVARLGVISIPDRRYDPSEWWRSSDGFRTVVSEAIAYSYARLVFAPQRPNNVP